MIYLLLKAAHVATVTTFVGGMLMLAVTLRTDNLILLRHVARWNRRVTGPALVLAWMSGLTLAMQGQWFGDVWLSCKLVLVACLSVSHAALSGTLRGRQRVIGNAPMVVHWTMSGLATIAVTGLIALLAVVKPL